MVSRFCLDFDLLFAVFVVENQFVPGARVNYAQIVLAVGMSCTGTSPRSRARQYVGFSTFCRAQRPPALRRQTSGRKKVPRLLPAMVVAMRAQLLSSSSSSQGKRTSPGQLVRILVVGDDPDDNAKNLSGARAYVSVDGQQIDNAHHVAFLAKVN